jgi:ABC-type polysaccharide/polyol phosphate export permease
VSALPTSEGFETADAVIRRVKYLTEHGVSMKDELKELWRYRQLLISMVRRELRIRYKNSIFGFMWSFINPLITVLVMTFVFKYVYQNTQPNWSAYVLSAYLPYTFFQMALMDSSQSVIASLPLIKKIYFPREILPLAYVFANFIHLVLAMCMFFCYLAVIYILDPRSLPFQATTLYLPIVMLFNLFLVIGFSLLISALNVFYEDVKYLVGIVTYMLFFMCPIMYGIESVYYRFTDMNSHGRYFYALYMLNPIATMIAAYRRCLLAPQPYVKHIAADPVRHITEQTFTQAPVELSWKLILVSFALSIFFMWYGYRVFNKFKWRFVERV